MKVLEIITNSGNKFLICVAIGYMTFGLYCKVITKEGPLVLQRILIIQESWIGLFNCWIVHIREH